MAQSYRISFRARNGASLTRNPFSVSPTSVRERAPSLQLYSTARIGTLARWFGVNRFPIASSQFHWNCTFHSRSKDVGSIFHRNLWITLTVEFFSLTGHLDGIQLSKEKGVMEPLGGSILPQSGTKSPKIFTTALRVSPRADSVRTDRNCWNELKIQVLVVSFGLPWTFDALRAPSTPDRIIIAHNFTPSHQYHRTTPGQLPYIVQHIGSI